MKRLLLLFILINVLVPGMLLFAQTDTTVVDIPSAVPVNPQVAGQGGSFTANASGYNSLFKNPAGFAMEDGSFTLTSANVWGFFDQSLIDFASNPEAYIADTQTQLTETLASVDAEDFANWAEEQDVESMGTLLQEAGFGVDDLDSYDSVDALLADLGVEAIIDDPESVVANPESLLDDPALAANTVNLATLVIEDVTGEDLKALPSGNFRLGANFGLLGIVGKGWGFGLNLNSDIYMKGATILGAVGWADTTATFTGGYSFEVLPDFLYIGADLRPMYKVYVPVSGSQVFELIGATDIATAMNAYSAYSGWGVGLDLGTIMKLGPLKLGLTVTDLFGTKMHFTETSIGSVIESFGLVSDSSTATNTVYKIPMDVTFGAAFDINLGDWFALGINAELDNMYTGIAALINGDYFDYLSVIHAGAYAELFNFIGVMAGYNSGYLSAGASFDLLIFELSAAAFVKANGARVGYSDFGATIEAAIRFD